MKKTATLLLVISAFIGSAQSLTFQQSFPNERISVRLTKSYGNWQHRIAEIDTKGDLMIGGIGYTVNSIITFTSGIDVVANTQGLDLRFETMVGRKFKNTENQIIIFRQYLINSKSFNYGFGVVIAIPQ